MSSIVLLEREVVHQMIDLILARSGTPGSRTAEGALEGGVRPKLGCERHRGRIDEEEDLFL